MTSYVLRRIGYTFIVMGVVAIFVFTLLYLAPGDPAALIAGEQASTSEVQQVRESLGLNRGFIEQFAGWSWRIVQGDLGVSVFTGQPVTTLIAERLEPTLSLSVVTLLFTVVIAIPVGTLAAWKVGSWFDRAVMSSAVLGFSVPVFVLGYLLAYLFAVQLHWLPVQGYTDFADGVAPWFRHLILPAIALSAAYIALVSRITRSSVIEIMHADFIRTARAKGVAAAMPVLFVHRVAECLVSIVTVLGIGMAGLMGGCR